MRVLCCLDGTNSAQIAKATEMLSQGLTLGLLHLPHEKEMLETEKASAQDILSAARRYFGDGESMQREGRPEREIVNAAAEWRADVVIVCSRAEYGEKAQIGPRSVGHVARFVLDHAPCPVLLVRPLARKQFPIAS